MEAHLVDVNLGQVKDKVIDSRITKTSLNSLSDLKRTTNNAKIKIHTDNILISIEKTEYVTRGS